MPTKVTVVLSASVMVRLPPDTVPLLSETLSEAVPKATESLPAAKSKMVMLVPAPPSLRVNRLVPVPPRMASLPLPVLKKFVPEPPMTLVFSVEPLTVSVWP